MTTRSKGKLKIWLFDECVVSEIRGAKPPTSKTVYLHFRYLHSKLQEKQPGTSSLRDSAKVAVENVKQWWLYKAGIPTKSNNTLIDMILKIHKNWTILFKQRLKTTQQQLDKRDAFSKEMKKTFGAPKSNCEKGLNEEDRKFLENMIGSRKGGVSLLDRVTVAKNKRKKEKVLQLKKRKCNEEQRTINYAMKSFITAEQEKDSKDSSSSDAGEEDADFDLLETFDKRKKQLQEKWPAASLNVDPTQWSETVSLVADKHDISHTALTEVMSAVVSYGGGNINDLSLSKETVRRHRNSVREQRAKCIFEKNLKTIHDSESNRYLLHWNGKMLQSIEHVRNIQRSYCYSLDCNS